MKTYNEPLAEVIASIVMLVIGLFAVRPVLNWLLIKLYNLFIGRGHI